MTLLYHRLMTPSWLKDNATFNAPLLPQSNELKLCIASDAVDYERIFKVPLLPSDCMKDNEDITVKMLAGVVLPEPEEPRDPMAYMISDGDSKAIGIQLRDPGEDYQKIGPYKGIQGEPGRSLDVATEPGEERETTQSRRNPDQFEITLKPSACFGSAYCAIEDGHKIVVLYRKPLKLSKGLFLEVYREKKAERYTINYVEVWVYLDSPKDVQASTIKALIEGPGPAQ